MFTHFACGVIYIYRTRIIRIELEDLTVKKLLKVLAPVLVLVAGLSSFRYWLQQNLSLKKTMMKPAWSHFMLMK